MKTNHIIKIVLLALLSVGISAQSRVTPPIPDDSDWTKFVGDERIDSVTVGSLMPYMVNTPSMTLWLEYMWLFQRITNGTANGVPLTVYTLDGTTPLTQSTIVPVENWYPYSTANNANIVSVRMPVVPSANANDFVSVRVNARHTTPPNVTIPQALCPSDKGNDEDGRIIIIPRPKIEWSGPERLTAVCLDDDFVNVTIPNSVITSAVAGRKEVEVEYVIRYFANFVSSANFDSEVRGWIKISEGTSQQLTFPSLMFNKLGLYEIQILNITDRISRKALNQSDLNLTTSERPDLYQVYIYPKPDAENLELFHIRNISIQ